MITVGYSEFIFLGNIQWSCLHEHFAKGFGEPIEQDYAIVILRKGNDRDRNIPEDIHNKLVNNIQKLDLLQVVTYNGDKSFEDTIKMFQRANIVIGLHGAAMCNLIFAQKGITVVEYLTRDIVDRPWEFYGTGSIGGSTDGGLLC